MSTHPYLLIPDLLAEAVVPAGGIHSQTLSDEGGVELVLFGFAAGESLSEHASARPAIIQVIAGEAELTVGGDSFEAKAGTWLRMPPGLAHSVRARMPLVMALYLLPQPTDARSGRQERPAFSSSRVGRPRVPTGTHGCQVRSLRGRTRPA